MMMLVALVVIFNAALLLIIIASVLTARKYDSNVEKMADIIEIDRAIRRLSNVESRQSWQEK